VANAVDLAIRVTSDTTKAVAGLDAATSKTSKLGKAGALAGKALAAGLAIGAAAAVKFAASAAEDQQQAAKLANALKTTTGATKEQTAAVEDWISAQGKAYGITDDQLRPALSSLATATKDVNKAQQLASIAMDISARRGLSLEAVSNKLAKAYSSGNVAALSSYGVAVKNADGTTKSLEQVTKSLANTYKGAAASSAKTAAGQWNIAKVQAAELGEEIGYKLIPFLTKAAAAGLKVVDWISRNQTTAAALVGTLGGLLAITWGVSKAMQAWAAITKVAAAAQVLLNLAMSANPVGLIVVGIAALVAGLVLAYKKSETFRNIVNGAFRGISKVVGVVVDFIKKHWRTMLAILTGPIGIAVAVIIKYRDKITGAFTAAISFVKTRWKTILAVLTGPIGLAVLAISKNWDKIKDGFVTVKDRLGEAASNAKRLVVSAFEAMWSPVQSLIDLVQDLIDKIANIDFPDAPGWFPGAGRSAAGGGRAFNNDGTVLTGKGETRTKVDVKIGLDDRRMRQTEQARARIYGGGQVTVRLA
jgi:phage-related protein